LLRWIDKTDHPDLGNIEHFETRSRGLFVKQTIMR